MRKKAIRVDLSGRLLFLSFFLAGGLIFVLVIVHAVLTASGVMGDRVMVFQHGPIAIEVSGEKAEQRKIEEALKRAKAVRIPARVYTGAPMHSGKAYKCLVSGGSTYVLECGRDGETEVYRTERAETPTALAEKVKAYSEWVTARDAKRG